MQAGTRKVEAGVETTEKAGASLREIITAAQHVGDMVAQIATAAAQQTSATQQISSNMDQMAKITHELAAGAQQSAKACADLSNLALDLERLVARFRLEDPRAGSASGAGTVHRDRPRLHTPRLSQPDTRTATAQPANATLGQHAAVQ
jgi:ABC-type transporter Mla subunit MlaD